MCRLMTIQLSVEEVFNKHVGEYDQPLEISHWETLSRIKSLFELLMDATLKLESENVATEGNILKAFTETVNLL